MAELRVGGLRLRCVAFHGVMIRLTELLRELSASLI